MIPIAVAPAARLDVCEVMRLAVVEELQRLGRNFNDVRVALDDEGTAQINIGWIALNPGESGPLLHLPTVLEAAERALARFTEEVDYVRKLERDAAR